MGMIIDLLRSSKREVFAIGKYLKERSTPKPEGPVRVGFLVDYLPAWSKVRRIYQVLEQDSNFQPILLCVPSNALENPEHNDTYEYLTQQGYADAVNTCIAPGKWLDLSELGLSYLFYLRPYNHLLPEEYHCHRVCCFTKVCLVLYGTSMTKQVADATMKRDFFRYVYCYFAESPYVMEKNRRDGWLLHLLGLQKSCFLGMPGVEELRCAKELPAPAWDFAGEGFRVMWTPRWTTDKKLGGSNFFTFHDTLLTLARQEKDTALLIRPHPMMLSNFVSTGEMTQQEVDAFRAECGQLPNVSLDESREYNSTFWHTDVLVTDISGMMIEYYVTGKPMIFCAGNMELTPLEHTARLISGCYVVRTEQELLRCLRDLRAGIDPLADKRRELMKDLLGGVDAEPCRAIANELAKDQKL